MIEYLIIPEPDFTVVIVEAQHMINKWLTLWMVLWGVEYLRQDLLAELELWLLGVIKGSVEAQEWSTELDAVTS